MRLAAFLVCQVVALAQFTPLEFPGLEPFRYAAANRPFRYTIPVRGANPPYSFALEEGATLPSGIALNAVTGELAGMVPQIGEYQTSVCISDAARAVACVPFLLIVTANEGETYTELSSGRAFVPYENLIAPPGTFQTVEYAPASGRLPPGMVLEITGRLYGTPAVSASAYAFRIRARDFEGQFLTRAFLFRVLGPHVAAVRLPNGFEGTPYSARVPASSDATPLTWSLRRGPLPIGFSITEDGRILGTPSFTGQQTFTLRAVDPNGGVHDREIQLLVEGRLSPILISNETFPGATAGVLYRQTLNISGGRGPYAARILGALPPGLSLIAADRIEGTPTTAGSYTFSIQVTDITNTTAIKTFTLIVTNLRYSGPAPIQLHADEPARFALTAEGGTAPYRWSFVSGALPPGIALTPQGVLEGTPTAEGAFNSTVRLTDNASRAADQQITIRVAGPRQSVSAAGIVNGASFASRGRVSPGEIINIFGLRLAPAGLQPASVGPDRRYPTLLSGVRILFGGIPAPILFISPNNLGAVVPYDIFGRRTVEMVVERDGVVSGVVNLDIDAAAPGIFTADSSGTGQAAATNEDGRLNSASNPASAGSILVMYATGGGQTTPPGRDGVLESTTPASLRLPVRVLAGGREAEVLYAGGAPALVAGLIQVNFRLAKDAQAGPSVPVVLLIGDNASPAGVTIAVAEP
jgi:uncharacterized protein (TIGR03437 family)